MSMTTAARDPGRPTDVAGAYRRCERITREQAANFYYGIRLLSPDRRRAMCAVYAFARRIDDIGDGEGEPQSKRDLLAAEREGVRRLTAQGPAAAAGGPGGGAAGGDPVLLALSDAAQRFPLPLAALDELIDGVLMDLDGVSYETFEELVVYCRRVAGTIGRLCLAIFGLRDGSGAPTEQAQALADDLGVALQLTNILRDVREDAGNGRVYLPGEDLERFGVRTRGGGEGAGAGAGEGAPAAALLGAIAAMEPDEHRLTGLVRFEAARAREWFTRGLTLADLLDRRSAACLLAMAGIYRRLLERIDADPAAALRARASLPIHEKAWVAARGMMGMRP